MTESLPTNLIEYPAQALALDGMDHFDEGYSTIEMQSVVGMSVSILALGAKPDAVSECCLETVEVISNDIHVPIRNYACQIAVDRDFHESMRSLQGR